MRPIDWIAVTILLLFAAGLRIIGISYGRLDPDFFHHMRLTVWCMSSCRFNLTSS